MPGPVCLAVHGVFAAQAYESLLAAGASRIVTTNSIPHESNRIDLAALVADQARRTAALTTHAPDRHAPEARG